jgi:hypothetical protein
VTFAAGGIRPRGAGKESGMPWRYPHEPAGRALTGVLGGAALASNQPGPACVGDEGRTAALAG